MPMESGFSRESPRIHRPSPPLKKHLFRGPGRLKGRGQRQFRRKSDSRRNTIIIMRATLHHGAPNTYYGQWPRASSKEYRSNKRSIARIEAAASAGIVALSIASAISQENRAPTHRKFMVRPKEKSATALYPSTISFVSASGSLSIG
ncbi:MAG: hypothetical protein J0J01_03665 [Reyranella sp.]|uniref:hypothetical protein n=1 Tax=Reyranella sp. TaxID=1929291 RepID=UPI001ACE94F2|nr:hypothetical protein [Reyranella sp.]MBN9085985.1 hypothetical protein [Reyranella sp.]